MKPRTEEETVPRSYAVHLRDETRLHGVACNSSRLAADTTDDWHEVGCMSCKSTRRYAAERNGDPLASGGMKRRTTRERWFQYVNVGDFHECWLWTGGSRADGYGLLAVGHDLPKSMLAHRWAYEHFIGPIPDGMIIRHTCDVRLCSNPHHLLPGTVSDNAIDSVKRGGHPSAIKTHCPKGHEYAGDNLSIHKSTGGRRCRACDRERHREAKRRASSTSSR